VGFDWRSLGTRLEHQDGDAARHPQELANPHKKFALSDDP
jgi:hypothetical protein